MTVKLGLLETGRPPEDLAHYPNYPKMLANWLDLPDAEAREYAVLDMELPASPDEADVWMITGSKFGAYEDHPWIPPLEDFIRAIRDAGKPLIGICFGHQIIAQALGGTVRKSDKGWGVAVHRHMPQNWPKELGLAPDALQLQVFHQDQVEDVPKGADVIASSEFCENAALYYPGFAVTFQAHPEFGADFVGDLIETRGKDLFTEPVMEQARRDVGKPINPGEISHSVRNWLKTILKEAET